MRFSEGSPIWFPAVFSEGSPVGLPAAFSEESPVRLLAEDLAERKKGMNRQEDTRRKTDYRIYRLSLPEVAVCLILYLGLAGIISFLYYNSPLPILIAAPGGVAALRVFRSRCIEKRQRQLYVELRIWCSRLRQVWEQDMHLKMHLRRHMKKCASYMEIPVLS